MQSVGPPRRNQWAISEHARLAKRGGAKQRLLVRDGNLVLCRLYAAEDGRCKFPADERLKQLVGARRLGLKGESRFEEPRRGREGARQVDGLGRLRHTLNAKASTERRSEVIRGAGREDAQSVISMHSEVPISMLISMLIRMLTHLEQLDGLAGEDAHAVHLSMEQRRRRVRVLDGIAKRTDHEE